MRIQTITACLLLSALTLRGFGLEGDIFPWEFKPLPGLVQEIPPRMTAALAGYEAQPPLTLCTNALSVSARYTELPRPGRGARIEVVYSNPSPGSFHLTAIDRTSGPVGARLLAMQPGGTLQLLAGDPPEDSNSMPRIESGASMTRSIRLSPATVDAMAGSGGLVVAYASPTVSGWHLYAESAPLPVLPEPWAGGEPPPLTAAEFQAQLTNWVHLGVVPWPEEYLRDYPDAAPFFPGVILDASLPETFRLEFARYMPSVEVYDPGVLQFIQNAPDKDAPLVIAALGVIRRSWGATPEEDAARDAAIAALYAMSLDPQYPLRFRMHAAKQFRFRVPYKEFRERSEPQFKLLAAHELRSAQGADFADALRSELRLGLTALTANGEPFAAGPLEGAYPENATVGEVASTILADLEAKWAAGPSWKD